MNRIDSEIANLKATINRVIAQGVHGWPLTHLSIKLLKLINEKDDMQRYIKFN